MREKLNTARIMAWVSLIGLYIPLLGIILAAVARSQANKVAHVAEDIDVKHAVESIMTLATVMLVFSGLAFVYWAVVWAQ